MTIEADTLVQLTQALEKQGLKRVVEITFIRAPYRHHQRWICSVA